MFWGKDQPESEGSRDADPGIKSPPVCNSQHTGDTYRSDTVSVYTSAVHVACISHSHTHTTHRPPRAASATPRAPTAVSGPCCAQAALAVRRPWTDAPRPPPAKAN